jgi:hypothetical protein
MGRRYTQRNGALEVLRLHAWFSKIQLPVVKMHMEEHGEGSNDWQCINHSDLIKRRVEKTDNRSICSSCITPS